LVFNKVLQLFAFGDGVELAYALTPPIDLSALENQTRKGTKTISRRRVEHERIFGHSPDSSFIGRDLRWGLTQQIFANDDKSPGQRTDIFSWRRRRKSDRISQNVLRGTTACLDGHYVRNQRHLAAGLGTKSKLQDHRWFSLGDANAE